MTKKRAYKIGEACKLLDIQPYVLRYWETEFAALEPQKSQSGQRVYTDAEIEVIRRIKRLLYEEGYTIAGAKKKLEANRAAGLEDHGPLFQTEASSTSATPGGDGAGDALDTPKEERIESSERGLREALAEARALLAFLDGPTR